MITYNPLSDRFLSVATVKTKNGQKDVRIILDVIDNIFYTLDDDGNLNIIGDITDDLFITGFTYSNNTFTIFQTSGNSLTATIDVLTGLTINGVLSASTIDYGYKYINTTPYSALTTDYTLGVDTTTTPITIYLPESTSTPNINYEIKDIGLLSGTKNITITAFGTDKIISFEESSNVIIDINGTSLTLFNNGNGKWIII
jgi:hypothetical protein